MKKLSLKDLKVNSFVTTSDNNLNKNTIQGGKFNTINTCRTIEYIVCEPVSGNASCWGNTYCFTGCAT